MASGFIVLGDGRCLAVHYPVYDAVLRSISCALSQLDPLRGWLDTQLPGEVDVELGFAFVRLANGEQVLRYLDVRGLTDPNQTKFEDAALIAQPSAGPHATFELVEVAISRLRDMIESRRAGASPLALSDWTTQPAEPVEKIGPGWE